jgi:hypothetical protein
MISPTAFLAEEEVEEATGNTASPTAISHSAAASGAMLLNCDMHRCLISEEMGPKRPAVSTKEDVASFAIKKGTRRFRTSPCQDTGNTAQAKVWENTYSRLTAREANNIINNNYYYNELTLNFVLAVNSCPM